MSFKMVATGATERHKTSCDYLLGATTPESRRYNNLISFFPFLKKKNCPCCSTDEAASADSWLW